MRESWRKMTSQRTQRLSGITAEEISKLVGQFEKRRSANRRYASFDYCFNYFRNFNEQDRLSELKSKENMQMSCLQIGFFLASWGMFRGKSHLGQEANASAWRGKLCPRKARAKSPRRTGRKQSRKPVTGNRKWLSSNATNAADRSATMRGRVRIARAGRLLMISLLTELHSL